MCVQSLVLDLRDNRGGLVSEGLEVARLFLEGVCMWVHDSMHGSTTRFWKVHDQHMWVHVPGRARD
jgi:C-terminal processing protease CtpA/Prc